MAEAQAKLNEQVGLWTRRGAAEKREMRQEYRKLIKTVEDDKMELLRPECGDLLDHVRKADELFQRIKPFLWDSRDIMALDARFMVLSSSLGVQKANLVQTSLIEFKADEFIEKLITKMDARHIGDKDAKIQIPAKSWQLLGNRVSKCFVSMTPAVSVLSGTFAKPIVDMTSSDTCPKKNLQPDLQDSKPHKIAQVKESKEATTEELERIYEIIQDAYRKEPRPIDYFELVVNPYSFAHTIENIFHLSFLVRDRYIQIQLNEDKIPEVIPLPGEKQRGRESLQGDGDIRRGNQAVVSLSMKDWTEIIEAYELTGRVPFIEPSKHFGSIEPVESMDIS